MIRLTVAVGLALVLGGCAATPTNGEKLSGDVRLQPVALSTVGGPAHCVAQAVLMNRSRTAPDWSAAVDTPATLFVPRNARVVEVACVASAGGTGTTRYLASEMTAEGQRAAAATGAMFFLLGGLPAMATGAAQRDDVYAFPDAVSVEMPPLPSAVAADRSAFTTRRAAEIESDTAEWHRLRRGMCEDEKSPGEKAVDDRCEQALNAINKNREQQLADLNAG